MIVTGRPALRFTGHRAVGNKVRFHLRFSSVLRGHPATLTIVPLTLVCAGRACTISSARPIRRTVILGRTVSLPLPARGQGYPAVDCHPPFLLADAPWTAAHAATRYLR